jgi:hypothetical protein
MDDINKLLDGNKRLVLGKLKTFDNDRRYFLMFKKLLSVSSCFLMHKGE